MARAAITAAPVTKSDVADVAVRPARAVKYGIVNMRLVNRRADPAELVQNLGQVVAFAQEPGATVPETGVAVVGRGKRCDSRDGGKGEDGAVDHFGLGGVVDGSCWVNGETM